MARTRPSAQRRRKMRKNTESFDKRSRSKNTKRLKLPPKLPPVQLRLRPSKMSLRLPPKRPPMLQLLMLKTRLVKRRLLVASIVIFLIVTTIIAMKSLTAAFLPLIGVSMNDLMTILQRDVLPWTQIIVPTIMSCAVPENV